MQVNFCPECGHRVQETSGSCYECGSDLEQLLGNRFSNSEDAFKDSLKKIIDDLIENNSDILKDLTAQVENGESLKRGMFFAVEMCDGKPRIRRGDIKELEKLLSDSSDANPYLIKAHSEKTTGIAFKNVKVELTAVEGGKNIKISIPGIASIDDVQINRISDGLEILGKSVRTIYFAKVTLGSDFEIRDKKLQGNILSINVT